MDKYRFYNIQQLEAPQKDGKKVEGEKKEERGGKGDKSEVSCTVKV